VCPGMQRCAAGRCWACVVLAYRAMNIRV
jgi:hypothetical protein